MLALGLVFGVLFPVPLLVRSRVDLRGVLVVHMDLERVPLDEWNRLGRASLP